MHPDDIIRWLKTLADYSTVAIDNDGLRLIENSEGIPTGNFVVIGGHESNPE